MSDYVIINGVDLSAVPSLRGKRGKGKRTLDYKAIAQRVAADRAHNAGLSIRAAASQYLDTSHDDFENHIRGVERALKAQSQSA